MANQIRQLGFTEILERALRLLQSNFALLVGITACFQVPAAFLRVLKDSTGNLAAAVLALLASLVILIGQPMMQAAVTRAIGDIYLACGVTLGSSYRSARAIVFPLLGTYLLAGFAVIGGLLALVIPGIYLFVKFLFVGPVAVLEGKFYTIGMRRSRELVTGHRWRSFGMVIVVTLLAVIVCGSVYIVCGLIPFVGWIVFALAQAMTIAFGNTVLVVLYFDLRCRLEEFDLRHLAEENRL